jgi:hypothetical protein
MNTTIKPLVMSGSTAAANLAVSSKAGLHIAMMAIGMAKIDSETTKASEQTKKALANVNRLDAANQLTSQLNELKALRSNNDIAKDKTMEKYSTDTAQFGVNLEKAGITLTADEKTKLAKGTLTDADLETLSSKIKTMSDSASNLSQQINLELQRANNAVQQNTNMFMNFMDTLKQIFQNIFR